MKRFFAVLCTMLCFLTVGCAGGTEANPPPGGGSEPPDVSEGVLSVSDVFQYFGYAPIEIETKMDGKRVYDLDLYYDIIDPTVCEIENGRVNGLKVGSTDVYAQTVGGQEVKFEVDIRDSGAFIYDVEVRTREEDYKNKANSPVNPTLFVGDSFFDERNFWRSFYDDFEGLNCFTVGISGSQTSHWYIAKERLITAFAPKNIVIHIGTNDINDNSITLTVDGYYNKITAFLDMILQSYPAANVYYFGIENRNGAAGGKNPYSETVTEMIKTKYVRDKFTYLDTPAIFNANPNKYVSTDNIHPSVEGYKVYTQMLKEVVDF